MSTFRNFFGVAMIACLVCNLLVVGGCPAQGEHAGNTPPVARDDAISTAEDTPVSIPVLANDRAAGGNPLSVDVMSPPRHGQAHVNGDGTILYTPAGTLHGTDRFSYTLTDGQGGVATATVTITITPVAVLRPNVVLILTDDQRWDTLWAMPIVQDKLVAQGVTFTNAYVTTPLCCPSRASLLAGGLYPQHTGVLSNELPNGGAENFRDTETLAVFLQKAGYKTGLIGKYLNRYNHIAPHVPPGWTQFIATVTLKNRWKALRVTVGNSTEESAQGQLVGPVSQYATDFYKQAALRFLEQYGDSPFFLYFSPHAPHFPAIPAAGDQNLFAKFLYRDRAYQESDLTDKPAWVRQSAAAFSPPFNSLKQQDEFHRNQLRSLQAVDRAIGEIIARIAQKGKLQQTIFFFTSDNGLLWGEHGLFGKGKAYEESIRVPLVIKMPGIAARTAEQLVASNLDIAATLFDVAGITRATDGMSLLPLLKDPGVVWRKELLIQYFDEQPWAGLRLKQRQEEWKYVEHSSGEQELYDLLQDPYEEKSQHNNPGYQDQLAAFAVRLAALKGLASTAHNVPTGQVGQAYSYQLTAWGGHPPYTWDIVDGQLPAGLVLDSALGRITGMPTQAETQSVSLRVRDAFIISYTRAPQAFMQRMQFVIDGP